MKKIIECVPNFSEGTDQEVIDQILAEISGVEGVQIWDTLIDKDHNRTVVTFIGSPDSVKKAAIKSAKKAVELIDMTKHKGEHPRVGAVDVVPFVPLVGCTLKECVEIAQEVGNEIAETLEIPVYLYADAARRPELKNIAYIQQIQYEGLIDKIHEEDYQPDFGPKTLNKKSGACIVGARDVLVAFNVNLNTDDIKIARSIARRIRESGDGLKNIRAMGVKLEDKNQVQVSMDMTNYVKTPIYQALELIKAEAKRYGVSVVGSEIIGLIPTEALVETARYYLQSHDFTSEQLIENKIYQ